MSQNRESNFNLLRILSTFAVVMLHVSGSFLRMNEIGALGNCNHLVVVLNHIVRFAVPCFFMLSGAFILADERNADFKCSEAGWDRQGRGNEKERAGIPLRKEEEGKVPAEAKPGKDGETEVHIRAPVWDDKTMARLRLLFAKGKAESSGGICALRHRV